MSAQTVNEAVKNLSHYQKMTLVDVEKEDTDSQEVLSILSPVKAAKYNNQLSSLRIPEMN